jgi:trk system potassium uptake protein TrkH
MNVKLVVKLLAILIIIICAFMIIPAAMAAWFGERAALLAFVKTIVGGVFFSAAAYVLCSKKAHADSLRTRDSFVFVTLSWVLASAIGAMPFYLSGAIPSITDSYFETMSGFSTTGASILTDIEKLPHSILFWRALTHWLGGMGIVVLAVAILPFLGVGGLQLIDAEAPGPSVDKLAPRIAQTAKLLWFIYIGLTACEIILLKFGGMSLFDSSVHTFATVATGGFSTKNMSVAHYNSAYIDAVITVFMLLAGINFSLHFRFISGMAFAAMKDTELRVYIAIFLISVLIITFNLYASDFGGLGKCLRYSSFQAASILTTTGYATADFEKWPYASQFVLFFLMFVGGCAGSTGGGIKVIRLVTLLKQAVNEMKSLIHPRGVFSLKIGRTVVKNSIANAVAGFFFLYIMTVLATTFVVALAGHDILTSFTTALSTVGNIGPGFGLVGPAENYSFFQDYVKWFLSFSMLAGRLELYTVLVIFTPFFWRK